MIRSGSIVKTLLVDKVLIIKYLKLLFVVIFGMSSTMQVNAQIERLNTGNDRIRVRISQEQIEDLDYRLSHIRWPDQISGAQWEYGTSRDYLQSLLHYWRDDYQWEESEHWLNTFDHYKSDVQGIGLHYIHHRSDDEEAIPLLVLHGWPSTFVQMLELIPRLTHPKEYGLDGPSFHVVVASLPGFGFSDRPEEAGMHMEKIAELMSELMTVKLGYSQYGARGSDLGGTVIDQIARHSPQELIGIHLTGIIVAGGGVLPEDASQAEKNFLQQSAELAASEIAYARMHMTKPQTVAYALNDSPVGLAAWIVEKYHSWGDTQGDVESRFSKDYLLTTLSTFWFTETINSSMRTYYEMVRNRGNTDYIDVPTGMLMSHQDLFPYAPREWAERSYNVVHWSETYAGGHFLEWEEPQRVASDIQTFFSNLK